MYRIYYSTLQYTIFSYLMSLTLGQYCRGLCGNNMRHLRIMLPLLGDIIGNGLPALFEEPLYEFRCDHQLAAL